MYLRANIYYQRGQDYEPVRKTKNQYEIKRARELCEQAFARFPKSVGGINARNLINQIDQPGLNLLTEKVNVPGQPFRTLVKYRNVKTLYLRVIKTSRSELKTLERTEYEKQWKAYTELRAVKSWNLPLPNLQDHQEHSLEVKTDALENGTYILLASLDEHFSLNRNIIARQVFQVSQISYIKNNSNEYYVLHRDNGRPLSGAQVQLWQSVYNYEASKYEEKKMEKYTSDKNGLFKIPESKEYRNFLMQFNYGTDELFTDDYNYSSYYNSYKTEPAPQTFMFTDRSIYRPGQTVYFKGIVLQKETDAAKSAVIPGFRTTITFKDANSQRIADLKLVTNEYGSYKGSFRIPEGGMNGSFSLYDSATKASRYIRVEEYKRPKFFTEVQKPKGTYRINDSINVTGTAKAYAGNNIDGAKVKFRVVRKVRYPVWWGWGYYRNNFGSTEETEITNGEAITDAKGEFTIRFKALPDESVDKSSQPVFHYEVSADITDINGETRSGSSSVAVAYQALQLHIDGMDELPADSLKNLVIRSTNLNDIHEKTRVKVMMQKLVEPNRIFRKRFWEMPDQFVMSRDEYYNLFPFDVYQDEDQLAKWPLGDIALDRADTTAENGLFSLSGQKITAGWYKIIATAKDKYGEEVRAEKYIQLTSERAAQESKQPISLLVQKSGLEPGETLGYQLATGYDKIWLIHSVSRMNKPVETGYYDIDAKKPLALQSVISESDRGGMALGYAFVQHNRLYSGNESIAIPWSNKQLQIRYETFRDKMLPGSEEKWKVKITGPRGEKIAAEILAAMYDASLDQFAPHQWSSLYIWPYLNNTVSWVGQGFTLVNSNAFSRPGYENIPVPHRSYDQLSDIGLEFYSDGYGYRKEVGGRVYAMSAPPPPPVPEMMNKKAELNEVVVTKSARLPGKDTDKDGILDKTDNAADTGGQNKPANNNVQIRKNFNETAFFFPELKTDAEGQVEFSFTMPEALTQWKLMTLAHTRNLVSGYLEKTAITQKPLMVQPNAPRFMREGDRMEFSAKIVNLGENEVTGTAQLELIDAASGRPVDGWFKNVFPNQYFTVAAGQSVAVKFPMEIPFNFNSALTYRIKAITKPNALGETFSDGEEMAFPVLTNRMLVTESLPLNLRNQTSKNFKFEKLLNSSGSNTISQHALTVEYTSNPAWYAVQSLPYLMEYPYDCVEQTFNRYYANTLASHISQAMPRIKAVFEKWKNTDTAALLSNLQKNEELKSALLQETPWVLEAQSENQQKKNIALLFDMVKMSSEQDKALGKLKEMQSSNGGFTWFKGGADDRYMTQYIITGIGHLKKLNAFSGDSYQRIKGIVEKAIPYLDKKIKEDYDELIRYKAKLSSNNLGYYAIQYLYMRSFFPEYKVPETSQTAYKYYRGQSQKYWLSNSKYMQAMIALSLHRTQDEKTPAAIIRSLKENAIIKEEMGMYWKEWTTGGYYWHQAPIESQAMMIEAFTDIDKNVTTIDDLKTWLLKQKQTQNWKTTKATAEACYALLLGGSTPITIGGLAEEKEVTISLGNTVIKSSENATEAGTGYFKKRFDSKDVKPEMGNITVSTKIAGSQVPASGGGGTSWGSIYWQYFEDLDKITPAETPLKLNKKLFIEKNTEKGPVLVALEDGATLQVGDKVKVRIELRVDRNMEYVHMKDMRAACMEPVNVLSQYKYQGGLGYYESTKDASTNFFFGWLNKGTYVFEYTLLVTHTGNFSNGITTIQCMYAPEFTSHSEGIRVSVE
ncbi:MAG: alpha-2-macroglobulin [Chitinophagaceae bacterium]|nr:alpha-2-macroglobulin [Chitinophagaceae bacterium]